MIFIANVLLMNGGTTFLLRVCAAMKRLGRPCAVLVLRDAYDDQLVSELRRVATVLPFRDYQLEGGRIARAHLGAFAPIKWAKLEADLRPFGAHVHVMGVFGLLLGLRIEQRLSGYRVSAGVYHQNEFLFESSPLYFPRKSQSLFMRLPARNIIFYNESVRENYGQFFEKDYSISALAPIGVDLDFQDEVRTGRRAFKIISVGNLVSFKTYNRHMIDTVALLRDQFPQLEYEIYGTGPEAEGLARQIQQLGLEQRVRLCGPLPYDRYREVCSTADLFVGSGTALVEAAALGVPALVGIESIATADTYGFLSDVPGFSYNEDGIRIPKYPIIDLVRRLFSDDQFYEATSSACVAKAHTFGVDRTVSALQLLARQSEPAGLRLSSLTLARMSASLIGLGVTDRIFPGRRFRDRRNQSYSRS